MVWCSSLLLFLLHYFRLYLLLNLVLLWLYVILLDGLFLTGELYHCFKIIILLLLLLILYDFIDWRLWLNICINTVQTAFQTVKINDSIIELGNFF